MQSLQIKRLTDTAKLPTRAYPTDSGLDLYSDISGTIGARSSLAIHLGVAIQLEPGYEAQIRPKSGLCKKGIMATFGTIDTTYVGQLVTIVYNFSDSDYRVNQGDKIAQLVICPVICPTPVEVTEDFAPTDRGSNGFGSTGI